MKFDKGKYKVLHLGQKKAEANMDWLGSSSAEKNLEVLVGRELNMSQQFAAQQRTAACWVLPVRLSSKSYPLSGTPEIASHSFGLPIRKKTLTYWSEFNGGPPR